VKELLSQAKLARYVYLIFLLGLAFFLRVVGIRFGLPDLYHADEPIVVNHAFAYGTWDLNPHFFKLPPLVSYLLFVIYGFYFLLGHAFGLFKNLREFINLFLVNPSSFYLVGRVFFGAVIGTLTVYSLFKLIQKYFSEQHAFLSALMLAICFLHVRDSHYIYVDIPLLFVLVLCFFPILQMTKDNARQHYILFGFLAGAAVATKYNGVFIFIPFLVSHFLKNPSKSLYGNLFLAFITAFAVYGLLNPFSLLDFRFFLSELLGQSHAEGSSGLIHHLIYSLMAGLGVPMFVFSILGSIAAIISRDVKKYILSSFIFGYYIVLCFFSQPYDRYVLPLIPFLCFFAADFLLALRSKCKLSSIFYFFLIALTVLPSIVKVYLSDYLFIRKDVRTIAKEWVEQTLPAGAKVALDNSFYAPRLKLSVDQLKQKEHEISAAFHIGAERKRIEVLLNSAQAKNVPRYSLYFLKDRPDLKPFIFSTPTVLYNVNYLKQNGIEYIVTCRLRSDFNQQFYSDLEKRAKLLVTFSPYKDSLREWPIDSMPLTGGPLLWSELIARKANGQIIKIYELE